MVLNQPHRECIFAIWIFKLIKIIKHKIMKTKFLLMTGVAITLFLTACKTEEPSNTSSVLPKKIVETYSNSTASRTMDFTYNGNKISEILITPASDVSKIKYTYAGDDVVKIENFIGQNYDKYNSTEFTYLNGKVATAANKKQQRRSSVPLHV